MPPKVYFSGTLIIEQIQYLMVVCGLHLWPYPLNCVCACMQLLFVSQRLLACMATNQGVACIRIHKYGMIAIMDSLGGKWSDELGQNPWACTEEFLHANEIAALLSHVTCKLTAGMQHRCITV